MTCITTEPTKKALKERITAYNEGRGGCPSIVDPSIICPYSGPIIGHPNLREMYGNICVTNHPKRSWFAVVSKTGRGLSIS